MLWRRQFGVLFDAPRQRARRGTPLQAAAAGGGGGGGAAHLQRQHNGARGVLLPCLLEHGVLHLPAALVEPCEETGTGQRSCHVQGTLRQAGSRQPGTARSPISTRCKPVSSTIRGFISRLEAAIASATEP